MSKKINLNVPKKKPDWKVNSNYIKFKNKDYSNQVRKPKTFNDVNVRAKKNSVASEIFGDITIPVSKELSIMLGGRDSKQKFERKEERYRIEQNIKNQYRKFGVNVENINFNYKQQSTKGKVNVTGNKGETYYDGNFKSDMQRAAQLNIYGIKLNKSGTLTGNVSLTSGTRGLNAPEMPRDPMYPNREDFDPGMNKYENKGYVGINYKF